MQKQLAHWNQNKTYIALYVLLGLYLPLFLPFWKPVLLALLFAAACAPVVNSIRYRLQARRSRVAYATVGLSLAFLLALISVLGLQIYSQLFDLFRNPESMGNLNDKIAAGRDQLLAWANSKSFLSSFNVKDQLDRAVVGISGSAKTILLNGAQVFVSQAPTILLNLFVFLVAFAAFLVSLPSFRLSACQALRLGEHGREHFDRFEKICALALGSVLLTGFVQSVMVTIGAAIAGFDAWLMIFAISFVLAMIPVLGAGLAPTILAIASFLQGNTQAGIIMIITAVLVGVTDNILRAWLFSRAAKSNPAISLITLLGGIGLMGFAGLFVAPVIEQLVMTYVFSDEGEPHPHQVTAKAGAESASHEKRPLIPRPT